ncbi:hypothetical protein [Streptomyces sp. URMC 123]|uniref:hypothetical protein n=1 Tax=Streptomyces sp. URMC 123 TaxID=3423403 RepID=UPI003F1A9252
MAAGAGPRPADRRGEGPRRSRSGTAGPRCARGSGRPARTAANPPGAEPTAADHDHDHDHDQEQELVLEDLSCEQVLDWRV